MPDNTEITDEERKNGWTVASLEAYRAERDKAAPMVAGLVVTEFKRPKPPIQLLGVKSYNPLRRFR